LPAIVPAVAVNVAFVAPDATVTEACTGRVVLLLDRKTGAPPAAAALERVTVQVVVPPVRTLVGAQEIELSTTGAMRDSVPVCDTPLYEPVITAL
jgi:hypothetical protein